MADDRIKLGIDTGDSAAAAESLASSLDSVKEAAQGVAAAHGLIADAAEKAEQSALLMAESYGLVNHEYEIAEAATKQVETSVYGLAEAFDLATDSYDVATAASGRATAAANQMADAYKLVDAEYGMVAAAAGRAESAILEIADAGKIVGAAAPASYKLLDTAVDNLADSYEIATTEVDRFVDSIMEEISASRGAGTAIDALGRSKRRAGTESDALGRSAGKTAGRMNELARGGLQASQALQDVAQGGPAAALNNVDGIVGSLGRSLGLSSTAAAALSGGLLGIGTAALVFGPAIWEWVNALSKGNEEIPETKSAMDKLNESMATAKARVDAMKTAWHGTKEEVEKYKTAQAELMELEKRAADQKAIDAQKAKEAAAAKEVDKPYADAAAKAVADFGGVDKFQASVERAQSTELADDARAKLAAKQKEREAAMAGAESSVDPNSPHRVIDLKMARDKVADEFDWQIKSLEGLASDAEARRKADAASMTAGFLGGDVGVGKKLEGMFPGRGFDVGGVVQKQRAEELAAMQKQVEAKEAADAAKEAAARQAKREQNRREEAKEEADAVTKAEKDKADFAAEQKQAAAATEGQAKAAKQAKVAADRAEAIAAIQGRGVGGDWTDEEKTQAADAAIAGSNAKLSGKESIDMGIAAVEGARGKRRDAAELERYEQRADAMTGGVLPQGQVEEVAKRVQGLVHDQKANPEAALQGVLQELMQAYVEQNARMNGLQSFGENAAQQVRNIRQQVAPMAQTMPSLSPYGR